MENRSNKEKINKKGTKISLTINYFCKLNEMIKV